MRCGRYLSCQTLPSRSLSITLNSACMRLHASCSSSRSGVSMRESSTPSGSGAAAAAGPLADGCMGSGTGVSVIWRESALGGGRTRGSCGSRPCANPSRHSAACTDKSGHSVRSAAGANGCRSAAVRIPCWVSCCATRPPYPTRVHTFRTDFELQS